VQKTVKENQMAEHTPEVKTTDNLPASVPAEAKKKIHEKLKGLVEQELSKESHTLGTAPGRPAIHGSISWDKALEK
jgi:hypothetical protein